MSIILQAQTSFLLSAVGPLMKLSIWGNLFSLFCKIGSMIGMKYNCHICLYFQRLSGENSPTKSPTEDVLNPLPKSSSHSALNEQRSIERSQVSDRFRKTRSVMIENLHFPVPPTNPSGPPPPKSATLPPNFQTPKEEVVSEFFYPAKYLLS